MKTNGIERCGHYAVRGGNVCKYHGGAAPQVQRAISARRMADLYGPMLAGLTRLLESNDLDAIAKACALISRQYGEDMKSGRLSPDQNPGATSDPEWYRYLETDELRELLDVAESYKQLARGRMEAGYGEWKRHNVGVVAPPQRQLAVIDVQASSNGNGNGE